MKNILQLSLLLLICLWANVSHGQFLKKVNLTNIATAKYYGHSGLIPNVDGNGMIYFGTIDDGQSDYAFFDFDGTALETNWIRKIPNGIHSMFGGVYQLEHLGGQKFFKLSYGGAAAGLSSTSYNNFQAEGAVSKSYESNITANEYYPLYGYPELSYSSRLDNGDFLFSGSFGKQVTLFSESGIPHITRINQAGDIIWSKSYESLDNNFVSVKGVAQIDETTAVVMGYKSSFNGQLQSTNLIFFSYLDLTTGELSSANLFEPTGDYWGSVNEINLAYKNGRIYILGSMIYLGDNDPGSGFSGGSFICEVASDLASIKWFVNYNGYALDYTFSNDGTKVAAVSEIAIDDGIQITGYKTVVSLIDIQNQGEVILSRPLEGDSDNGVLYDYIYNTGENYTLGYTNWNDANPSHHVLTLHTENLLGCDVQESSTDFEITTQDIVLGVVATLDFTQTLDLFSNQSQNISVPMDNIEDETLIPVEECNVSGIDEYLPVVDILVYPNPTSSYINIQHDSQQPLDGTTLYNQLGQIMNVSMHHNQIDISSLSKGLYFLEIKQDGRLITRKVVIE